MQDFVIDYEQTQCTPETPSTFHSNLMFEGTSFLLLFEIIFISGHFR
jgi:hypothetical protein